MADQKEILVQIPGMLYDPFNPPSEAVLHRVVSSCTDRFTVVTAPRLRVAETNGQTYFEELDISTQVDYLLRGVHAAISSEEKGERPTPHRVRLLSHSMGAVTMSRLFRVLRTSPAVEIVQKIALAPIPPQNNLSAVQRNCIATLLPKVDELSSQETEIFKAREGRYYGLDRNVWRDIDAEEPYYNELSSEFWSGMHVIVALNDRVYPESTQYLAESRVNLQVVDDTHSLKSDASLAQVLSLLS